MRHAFRRNLASALTVLALAPLVAASPQITSWLAPVDGSFNDPARWSAGVPTVGVFATFGAVPGGPFTVSLTQGHTCGWVQVLTQSLVLDGTGAPDASLSMGPLAVFGAAAPSLTLRQCEVTCAGSVTMGSSGGDGSVFVEDGAVLDALNSLGIGSHDAAGLLDLAPTAIVNAKYFSLNASGTTRWTIDGTHACFLNAQNEARHGGTIRIAFGPKGPPRPGTVLPLCTNPDDCDIIPGNVVFEATGRAIDCVVGVEGDLLVYRQLTGPLQLLIDVPPLPTSGYHAFVGVKGIADGHVFDLARQATLSSSDPRILQVVGPDRIIGIAPGQALLTASQGTASTSVLVTVGDEEPQFAAADDSTCDSVLLRGMSRDGRYVLFESHTALVPGDTNGISDVYVRDLDTATLERVSEGPNGEQGSQSSNESVLSGDGRFVVFKTKAPEIAGVANVLVLKDRITQATELIAVTPDGEADLAYVSSPMISADGRYVAFASVSDALVPGVGPVEWGTYVRDRLVRTTAFVSVGPDGAALQQATPVAMTGDGRIIAMETYLLSGPAGGGHQGALLVRDLDQGVTTVECADYGLAGELAPASLSDDGRLLAFLSVVDPDGEIQVAVRDRVAQTTKTIASLGWKPEDLEVALSPNGRYVGFHALDYPPQCTPTMIDNGNVAWRHDLLLGTTQRISERTGAPPLGETHGPIAFSADGRFCAFWTSTSDLMPADSPCRSALRRRFGAAHGADINADGTVGAADLALLISAWGSTDESADLDGDGTVGAADLSTLLAAWSA